MRQKYSDAIDLLKSYKGIEVSVDEQEAILKETQKTLEQYKYVIELPAMWFGDDLLFFCSKTLEFYSTTLFRGSSDTRPDLNDAFARSVLWDELQLEQRRTRVI